MKTILSITLFHILTACRLSTIQSFVRNVIRGNETSPMVSTRQSKRSPPGTNVVSSKIAPSIPSKRSKTTVIASSAAVLNTPSTAPASKQQKSKGSPPPSSTKKAAEGVRIQKDGRRVLFSLTDDHQKLIPAKLLCRPSKRNRSPYVADVQLLKDNNREALAHVPNLDMGGKCGPGATLLLKPAVDRKGVPVGANQLSPKYGTPKCEFIAQLLHVDESVLWAASSSDSNKKNSNNSKTKNAYPPTWVGAHPSLGERIAAVWLRDNLLLDGSTNNNKTMSPIVHVQGQVRNPCGTDNIRSDFKVTHADGTKRIVEIKTVVDTDYAVDVVPAVTKKKQCVFTKDTADGHSYTSRTALFPWGCGNQKGPDGEAVVSARAIHHVRELTKIATGELRSNNDGDDEDSEKYEATIVFVVIRGDAEAFSPNHQACPSFCRYLKEAADAGVQVIAKRVTWGEGEEAGMCFDDKFLPIVWPDL